MLLPEEEGEPKMTSTFLLLMKCTALPRPSDSFLVSFHSKLQDRK